MREKWSMKYLLPEPETAHAWCTGQKYTWIWLGIPVQPGLAPKLFTLNNMYKHREKPGAHAMFNTVQPHLSADFITNKKQRVSINGLFRFCCHLYRFLKDDTCLHYCSYLILTVVEALYRSFPIKYVDDTALLSLLKTMNMLTAPLFLTVRLSD